MWLLYGRGGDGDLSGLGGDSSCKGHFPRRQLTLLQQHVELVVIGVQSGRFAWGVALVIFVSVRSNPLPALAEVRASEPFP